jgi:hypothetical protein
MASQIEMRRASGPRIFEDQLLQGGSPVAGDLGKEFEGHGEDLARPLGGPPDIEDTCLAFAFDQELEQHPGPAGEGREVAAKLVGIMDQLDPGAVAADVRLGDQRKGQPRLLGERQQPRQILRQPRRGAALDADIGRQPFAALGAHGFEQIDLRFAAEPAIFHQRVGDAGQRDAAIAERLPGPIGGHGSIEQGRRPELEGRSDTLGRGEIAMPQGFGDIAHRMRTC